MITPIRTSSQFPYSAMRRLGIDPVAQAFHDLSAPAKPCNLRQTKAQRVQNGLKASNTKMVLAFLKRIEGGRV